MAPVQRGPTSVRHNLVGELRSVAESAVAAETSGTVDLVPARVGSPVQVGDLLVRLDSRSARITLAAADARLAAAQAELAGRSASRDRAEAERARLGKVMGARPDAISASALQEVELALAEAQAAVDAAQASLSLRRAERDAAQLELERCSLRSPVVGVVARQDARIGQRVAVGSFLVQVVATGELEALLDVGEGQAGRVLPGAPLTLLLSGRPELGRLETVVAGVVPAADGSSRNQKLRADLASAPAGWLPGLAVEGEVEVASLSEALQVPRDAVSGGAVYAIADGKAKKIPILVRFEAGAALVVEGELSGVDLVVVRGNEALSDGAAVTVVGGQK